MTLISDIVYYFISSGIKQDAIDLMLGKYRPDPSGPSPFVPRVGQESLSNNVTKIFVLLMMIFSSLLVLSPHSNPLASGPLSVLPSLVLSEKNNLGANMLLAMAATSFVVMYILYNVVKVGSKIGKKIVVHPQLIPEPLPPTN